MIIFKFSSCCFFNNSNFFLSSKITLETFSFLCLDLFLPSSPLPTSSSSPSFFSNSSPSSPSSFFSSSSPSFFSSSPSFFSSSPSFFPSSPSFFPSSPSSPSFNFGPSLRCFSSFSIYSFSCILSSFCGFFATISFLFSKASFINSLRTFS